MEQYSALASEAATIKAQIIAVNTSIAELENRLSDKWKNDLANATATLDATIQEKVAEITAAYSSVISNAKDEITAAYTAAIAESISSLETSMKMWVSVQLEGYYTIAEVDAMLAAIKNEYESKLNTQKAYLEGIISSLSTDLRGLISTNSSLIETLRNDISTLQNSTAAESANKIAENAAAIAKNAQDIIDNASAISSNSNDIEANTALIEANKTKIEANAILIAANKNAIEDIKSTTSTAINKNAIDIATNAENIAKNASLIAQNATAITNNSQAIADNAADILQLQQDLATIKNEITEAYKSVINTSINTLNGELRDEIATQISTINSRIDSEIAALNSALNALDSRINILEDEIDAIQQQIVDILADIADMKQNISDLMKRIQSVTYIPKYSDGKACIQEGVVELDFQISPKDAVVDIAANWQSILSVKAVYTITRAVSFIDMPVLSLDADEHNGLITISASGEFLTDDFYAGIQSANLALYVSDGNNEIASGYIPMTAYHPYNEIWYTSTNGEVIIPTSTNVFGANIISNNVIEGKGCIKFDGAVTSIGNSAFSEKTKLTSITIPETVTSIGDNAFNGCSKITSITIPNSVTSIGSYAFYDCSQITNIEIPNNVTSIGSYALYGCSSLTSIEIPNCVTNIGMSAFSDCSGIASVTIGNSVTSIGDYAFNNCSSLKDLYIEDGENILSLGYNTSNASNGGKGLFKDCPLETLYLGRNLSYRTSSTYGYSPFYKVPTLISVTIGNNVTNIGSYAFEGCSGITSITIPNSVTSIGSHAFAGCSGITSITIPNSVTSIDSYAFYDCQITSTTIPNSVTYIGGFAFNSLKELHMEDGEEVLTLGASWSNSIGKGSFYYCPLETLHLGRNLSYSKGEEYGYSPFYNKSTLTSVTIGNSVTNIGNDTFYKCSSLTSIEIPNSVTSIGERAFNNCSKLSEVTIGEGVTSISKEAFTSCPKLSTIYCKALIPPSIYYKVSYYGSETCVFSKNTNMKIYVPSESYEDYIQYTTTKSDETTQTNWYTYKSYIVPYDFNTESSVQSNNQICYTSSDGNIVQPYNTSAFEADIISNRYANGIGTITFNTDITTIGDNAFYQCSKLTSITMPDNVEVIGQSAFYGCNNLADVKLSANLTSIKSTAFRDCISLKSITIPDNISSIGQYIFYGCSNLNAIYCKATTPPAIYYQYYMIGSFPFNSEMKIYVPRSAIDSYTQYSSSSYAEQSISQINWSQYQSYIEPYDFE